MVPVWRHSSTLLFQRVERNESTPLVDDGLLIYTEGKNVVIALDARTGREFWRYNHPVGAAALCCGLVNRGWPCMRQGVPGYDRCPTGGAGSRNRQGGLEQGDRPRRARELNTYAAFHQLPYDSSYGTFSAIDVNTGRIRWQRRVDQYLTYGGALVTAGNLVFFGEKDGTLNALEAESGATLWRQRVDTHVLGPPIAFQVDGEERIAATSRRGISVLGLR